MYETLSSPVVTPDIQAERDAASFQEREQRLRESIRIIRFVSSMAGRELGVESVGFSDDVPTAPGIYVLDEHLLPGSEVTNADFDFELKKLSGRADSAHAVVAGDLYFDTKDTESGLPKRSAIEAAAKCFHKRDRQDRINRAQRELEVMRELKALGEPTLDPIALAIAPESVPTSGEVILVTAYEPGLMTLDNKPWGRGPTPANVEIANLAAGALGHFVQLGYRHGDAKIKNVAQSEDGRTGMIDFETTVKINLQDPFECGLAAYEDFGKLVDSLEQKGFFNADPRTKNELIDGLADSFVYQWINAPDDVISSVIDNVGQVVSNFKAGYHQEIVNA